MKLLGRVIDSIVAVEQALDRVKLRYKERFNRFAPARIVPYRGFGRRDLLHLRGRVLEANETGFEPTPGVWTNVRNTIRRIETDEIRGARVKARFRGMELETNADDEAFFEFRIEPNAPVEPGWHEVELEIVESMASEHTGLETAEILVPPQNPDFIVVSDLDDTVVRTGATDRFGMFRTVLLNDARTRLPFQGVSALYGALSEGPSGESDNPFFYLSRSPWNLYGMLIGFLDHHDLPKGPLLLKDYGMRSLLGDAEETYKRDSIDRLLELYPDVPLVLIGDSGQHDPEIYRRLAMEQPDRVRAIIIRDVTSAARDREVREIADELDGVGIPVIVATDSRVAALGAANLGLIAVDRVGDIEADRQSEASAPSLIQRLLSGSDEPDAN